MLERARHDASFEQNLRHFASYAAETEAETNAQADDQSRLDFVREARLLCRERPDLAERRLYFGRWWDAIHYLLSEDRRQRGENCDSDWVKRAVNGSSLLNSAPHSELYYVPPEEVKDIRAKFEPISEENFSEHWNAPAMYKAGVYKIHADDGSYKLDDIWEDFEKLREFYRDAATSGDGVLVWFS